MISPAVSLEGILAAVTCLCSSIDNGSNNFFTSLGNQVSMKYRNESFAVVRPNEITELKERFNQLESTLTKMHKSFIQFEATLMELKTMQVTTPIDIHADNTDDDVSVDECPANVEKSQVNLRIWSSTKVLCEEVQDKHWIVVLYVKDGIPEFKQPWSGYQEGFGTLDGDFFIGLDNLYLITNSKPHELLVEVQYSKGTLYESLYGFHDNFLIGNASEDYILKNTGVYTGTYLTNFFINDEGVKFSTSDRDNDLVKSENCARKHKAWWHGTECIQSPSIYGSLRLDNDDSSPVYSVTSVKFMIRPTDKN